MTPVGVAMSQEPVPVIALEYANPAIDPSPTWRRIVRVTHWVALGACALGTIVIAVLTTRYGVLSGLVIGPAGVLLVIGGAIGRDGWAILLGIGHVAVCLLFMLLVNLLPLNPDTAHVPMSIMGSVYTAAAWALAVRWGVLWRQAAPR